METILVRVFVRIDPGCDLLHPRVLEAGLQEPRVHQLLAAGVDRIPRPLL